MKGMKEIFEIPFILVIPVEFLALGFRQNLAADLRG